MLLELLDLLNENVTPQQQKLIDKLRKVKQDLKDTLANSRDSTLSRTDAFKARVEKAKNEIASLTFEIEALKKAPERAHELKQIAAKAAENSAEIEEHHKKVAAERAAIVPLTSSRSFADFIKHAKEKGFAPAAYIRHIAKELSLDGKTKIDQAVFAHRLGIREPVLYDWLYDLDLTDVIAKMPRMPVNSKSRQKQYNVNQERAPFKKQ